MIAIGIKDIKTFMARLLNSDLFHCFLLKEAQISTYNNFFIEGRRNNDYFTREELEESKACCQEYSTWELIQPIVFQLIKGKKVPSLLKITLLLSPDKLGKLSAVFRESELSPLLKYFVLTIKYDSHGLVLTTGTSFSEFVADKSQDTMWDQCFCKFLWENTIDYEI